VRVELPSQTTGLDAGCVTSWIGTLQSVSAIPPAQPAEPMWKWTGERTGMSRRCAWSRVYRDVLGELH